jgi:hypothetical protein
MYSLPVQQSENDAVFHLVWTYDIKAVDGCKKAWCVCDGSTRSGKVQILAETYANCIDQTSAQLFYAVALAENLLIFGADVSNAFDKAPLPKQPFFIRLDRAFCNWWTKHLKREPIPEGAIIPVLSAMQGRPESPRLWEKHADNILCDIGLTPTVHEPCLYSGTFDDRRVLFLRQVDNFAIAAPDAQTSNIVMDLINDRLTIPIKRQGYSEGAIWDLDKIHFIGVMGKNTPIKFILSKRKLIICSPAGFCTYSYICRIEKKRRDSRDSHVVSCLNQFSVVFFGWVRSINVSHSFM